MATSKKTMARAIAPPIATKAKAPLNAANGPRPSGVAHPIQHGIKLATALAIARTPPAAVVPGLVCKGVPTFVRVASGVDAQIYATIVSVVVAAGQQLAPYGNVVAGPVLLVYRSAIETRVLEQCELLCNRFQAVEKRHAAQSNLHLYRTDLGSDDEGSLIGIEGRKQFDRSIPPDCKLAVFYDVARCLRKGTCSEEDFRELGQLLDELNRRGIATLVFYRASKSTDTAFSNELLDDCNGYTLELTEDRSAPREYGTGFTVRRHKTSEHDTVPTCFQFWYTVMNDTLDLGWQLRAPDEAITRKQIDIAERQKRVADLLESGMQQKDIATALGVNSATVSRDASALKTKAKHTSQGATETAAQEN